MISNQEIFNIKNQNDFNAIALKVFKFQFENNSVYRSFCDLINRHPSDVKAVENIPFLPISFFKTHEILSTNNCIQKIF